MTEICIVLDFVLLRLNKQTSKTEKPYLVAFYADIWIHSTVLHTWFYTYPSVANLAVVDMAIHFTEIHNGTNWTASHTFPNLCHCLNC